MKIFDALIIGSSYFSTGVALRLGSSLTVEEESFADTRFSLTARSFRAKDYTPKSEEGRELLRSFLELGLIRSGMMNTTALEIALSDLILRKDIDLLLKCRVVDIKKEGELFRATLSTNEGLNTVLAKKIINTRRQTEKKRHTSLFLTDDPDSLFSALEGRLRDIALEPAFYDGRYALSFDASGFDENSVKEHVYRAVSELCPTVKILYMAPAFAYLPTDGECPTDEYFESPLEALDAGILYAEEMKNAYFKS